MSSSLKREKEGSRGRGFSALGAVFFAVIELFFCFDSESSSTATLSKPAILIRVEMASFAEHFFNRWINETTSPNSPVAKSRKNLPLSEIPNDGCLSSLNGLGITAFDGSPGAPNLNQASRIQIDALAASISSRDRILVPLISLTPSPRFTVKIFPEVRAEGALICGLLSRDSGFQTSAVEE
jgi:hypothetical protein